MDYREGYLVIVGPEQGTAYYLDIDNEPTSDMNKGFRHPSFAEATASVNSHLDSKNVKASVVTILRVLYPPVRCSHGDPGEDTAAHERAHANARIVLPK